MPECSLGEFDFETDQKSPDLALGRDDLSSLKAGCAVARAAATVALAAGLAPAVLAQGAVPPAQAVAAEGPQVFEAAYFGAYNPVNAFDMVNRIPGFEIDDGEARRGFGGTAGNVLVNGERPSSKTIISDQLKRIPAGSVLRLELISGSASGSDVRGQSQLVNVVLKTAGQAASPTTFVLGARYLQYAKRVGWTAQASRSFRLSETAELAVDVQLPNLRGRSEWIEEVRAPDGSLREVRDAYAQANNLGATGSAALKWKPTSQDSVNLNVQYAPTWNTTGNASYDHLADGRLSRVLTGRSEYSKNYTGEVGADWEHRFSGDLAVKAIGLVTMSNVDQSDEFDIAAPLVPRTIVRQQERSTEGGERVGRVMATWKPAAGHTLQFGGEGAFNYRDTTLDIRQAINGGAFSAVPLDVSDARVEEVRGEVFVSDVWNVSPAFTLEGGFTFEASRITQTGSEENEREFTYPKPRIVATYVLPSSDQIRASVERDISQLDFSEFASTVNFTDGSALRGNPDLEPEKTWKARLEWERRFGKRGALTVALFHDAIEDVKDYIGIPGVDEFGNPITDANGAQIVQDAFGNIGDGSRTGIELRGQLPLAPFGIPNAELRFSGQYLQSEVTDPWTGEKRTISIPLERTNTPGGAAVLNTGPKDWGYILTYRQDLPKLSIAYGATVLQWSGRREYKFDEYLSYDRPEPRIDLYVETTVVKPLTIRVGVNNVLSASEDRERQYYYYDRAGGALTHSDIRATDGGPEGSRAFTMQVSGRF
jgi:hypothetical protein